MSSTDTDGSSPGNFNRKRLSKDVRSYDIVGKSAEKILLLCANHKLLMKIAIFFLLFY